MYIKYNLISYSSTLFMYICVVREDIKMFFLFLFQFFHLIGISLMRSLFLLYICLLLQYENQMDTNMLLKEPVYHLVSMQCELYKSVYDYMKDHDMSRSEMADYLGCSKNKLKRILTGNYSGTISDFINILLKVNVSPNINFKNINDVMEANNKQRKVDELYMRMAFTWAENSYCKRRQVGALIVKDNSIISDGYNGTPSGFPNVCKDCNNTTYPYVLHAEANAITKLARSTQNCEGATIYITSSPCVECAKLIIQSGIKRVVYGEEYRFKDGIKLLEMAGISVDEIKKPD